MFIDWYSRLLLFMRGVSLLSAKNCRQTCMLLVVGSLISIESTSSCMAAQPPTTTSTHETQPEHMSLD